MFKPTMPTKVLPAVSIPLIETSSVERRLQQTAVEAQSVCEVCVFFGLWKHPTLLE